MLNRRWIVAFVFLGFVVALEGISSGQMTPKEILAYADNARGKGNLEGVKCLVNVVSNYNNTRQDRTLDILSRGHDFFGILIDPPQVKNQKILMIDHKMWYTKPGLKRPISVSPRQVLIGGVVYGDVTATNYADDYAINPMPDETINGEQCYVLDLKAVSKVSTYDRIKYWISKERMVGVKKEFYTVSGKLLKTAVFEYDTQIVAANEPNHLISKMTITDALVETNITTMIINNYQMVKIPDSTFYLNVFSGQ